MTMEARIRYMRLIVFLICRSILLHNVGSIVSFASIFFTMDT